MKKILLFIILILFATTLYAARHNIYEMLKGPREIEIFLRDITDKTGDPDVKTDVFRDVFEDVIRKRIKIKFIPVVNEEDADIIVNVKIKEYVYTENPLPIRAVPIIMIPFVAAADIAEPKSSGKLVVDYEVIRTKDNKVLFSYKNLATDTRKPKEKMTEKVAYTYALKENINRFIYRAFYKREKRR